MKEESVKHLFRRFVSDKCGPKETLEVIEMLQNQEAVNWFGVLMDQVVETDISEDQGITGQDLEQLYDALESKMALNPFLIQN